MAQEYSDDIWGAGRFDMFCAHRCHHMIVSRCETTSRQKPCAALFRRPAIKRRTRVSTELIPHFDPDYVVTVAAGFAVEHSGSVGVIEASLRLACR